MLYKTRSIAVSIYCAAMLMSCGFGGGGTAPPVSNPPVATAANWGMPGGNPAHTRLSPGIGPSTPELKWATLSEHGTSSQAVVTPDGTVVVGAGLAVIAFNPDGTVRWRRPALKVVVDLVASDTGMVAFSFDTNTVHLVSPEGELLQEFRVWKYQTRIIGVDSAGSLFTWTNLHGLTDDVLVGYSFDGEILWQLEIGPVSENVQLLADGNLACIVDRSQLVVVDKLGQEQWRVAPADWRLYQFWQAENGNIFAWGNEFVPQTVSGYQVYSPTGDLLESVSDELHNEDLRNSQMVGVTSEGNPAWSNPSNGVFHLFGQGGELLWLYEANMRIVETSFGPNGEVYLLLLDNSSEPNLTNLLGFNSTGEIILSLVYESNARNAPVVDQLGRVCFGNNDGFFAYNLDREMAWGYDLGGSIGSIAVGQDGTVYSTAGNVMYATAPNGIEQWRYSAAEPLGVVLVGTEGNIYTHTANAVLELTADGTLSRYLLMDDEGSLGISMGSNGHLYSAGSTGLVRAFMPGLLPSWEYQAPGAVTTRIAIGEDGGLYYGCNNGLLYALDAAGQLHWDFDMQSSGINTPVVVGDSIYATSAEGGLFKIAHDGRQIWRYEPTEYCYTSPSIGPDGTVYFGTDDYLPAVPNVLASPPAGQPSPPPAQTSQFGIEAKIDSVLLDLNGAGQGLYAVSADGTLRWNLHSNYPVREEVAVDAAGFIYLSLRGQLYSLYPDGTERWRNRNYYKVNTPPVIGNDGSILLGTANMLSSFGAGR